MLSKKLFYVICMLLTVVCFASCNRYKQTGEVSVDDAVSIATTVAKSKNLDVGKLDVEALKVKNNYEKGPMRLAIVVRFFPKDKYKWLLDNEYWIVYFYSKGALDKPEHFGGKEFYVLVDLHTGKVINSVELY